MFLFVVGFDKDRGDLLLFLVGPVSGAEFELPELLQNRHPATDVGGRVVEQRLKERRNVVLARPGAKLGGMALERVHLVVDTADDFSPLALMGLVVVENRRPIGGLLNGFGGFDDGVFRRGAAAVPGAIPPGFDAQGVFLPCAMIVSSTILGTNL